MKTEQTRVVARSIRGSFHQHADCRADGGAAGRHRLAFLFRRPVAQERPEMVERRLFATGQRAAGTLLQAAPARLSRLGCLRPAARRPLKSIRPSRSSHERSRRRPAATKTLAAKSEDAAKPENSPVYGKWYAERHSRLGQPTTGNCELLSSSRRTEKASDVLDQYADNLAKSLAGLRSRYSGVSPRCGSQSGMAAARVPTTFPIEISSLCEASRQSDRRAGHFGRQRTGRMAKRMLRPRSSLSSIDVAELGHGRSTSLARPRRDRTVIEENRHGRHLDVDHRRRMSGGRFVHAIVGLRLGTVFGVRSLLSQPPWIAGR